MPTFPFRMEPEEVEAYRMALGVGSGGAMLGMALRAATAETVVAALTELSRDRLPIHVAQEYRADRPLRSAADYCCDIRLLDLGNDRLRIEQTLRDTAGRCCAVLVSEIVLAPDPKHAA
ncbi:MAG: hypothetical protein IOC82_11785 [Aestuariivirga sp.]|uniref:hypothetical protein n=1 Tax=Aestuariivirga sp. TaxID=2650926 RepID=UPI0025C45660|nr:hypothetical protein [Aestuariivirga sp.]MCA3561697.1 hypothetical protein [Aestuariivirga sp.]